MWKDLADVATRVQSEAFIRFIVRYPNPVHSQVLQARTTGRADAIANRTERELAPRLRRVGA